MGGGWEIPGYRVIFSPIRDTVSGGGSSEAHFHAVAQRLGLTQRLGLARRRWTVSGQPAGIRSPCRTPRSGVSAEQTARGILTAIQGGVVMLQATGRLVYLESGLAVAMKPLAAAKPVSA